MAAPYYIRLWSNASWAVFYDGYVVSIQPSAAADRLRKDKNPTRLISKYRPRNTISADRAGS